MQGIVLKPRFSRGGHVFEVPILMSPVTKDYPVLLASYLLPPAISLAVKFWVVKPLKRRHKVQKVRLCIPLEIFLRFSRYNEFWFCSYMTKNSDPVSQIKLNVKVSCIGSPEIILGLILPKAFALTQVLTHTGEH